MKNYFREYVAPVLGFLLSCIMVLLAFGGIIGGVLFCVASVIVGQPAMIFVGLLIIGFGIIAASVVNYLFSNPY